MDLYLSLTFWGIPGISKFSSDFKIAYFKGRPITPSPGSVPDSFELKVNLDGAIKFRFDIGILSKR